MSFFNSIKRLFGFGEDDFEEEIGIDATVTPRSALSADSAAENGDEGSGNVGDGDAEVPAPEETPVNIDAIFEHVLKVFNESLPPFIKESVDAEAQRKYLYDTLNESVKVHLENVRTGIAQRMEFEKRREMTQLRKQLHEAGEKARRNEESSGEWKRQQLSAERQKRALAERIHDLENTINELQAEREQFELENKSLVNRLRVCSVQDEDVTALRQQVIDLQEQLDNVDAGKVVASSEAPAEGNVITDEELQIMKTKQEMADSMINDLNSTASQLKQELAAMEQRNAELTLQVEQAESDRSADAAKIEGYEKELGEMSQKMKLLSDELQATQQELSAANENLSMMDTIHEQLEKLDEIIEKKNSRIKELQEQNEALKKRNDSLGDELMSLKKTIESNLLSQARFENEMQKVIDGLKDELARVPRYGSAVEEPTVDQLDMPGISDRGRKKNRKASSPQPSLKISAIDESLESTDWLVATPPEGTPTLPGMSNDSDFGYKEPTHKTPPENDAQMSLW